MKTLLVLPANRSYVVQPNLGLGYLASVIRKAGKEVAILDCLKDKIILKDFSSIIEKDDFGIVGFHMFSQDYNIIKELTQIVKGINPRIYTIVGGPHPTGDPASIMEDFPNVDFGFSGEGEIGIPKLITLLSQGCSDTKELSKIEGLYWKGKDPATISPASISELDALPFPAWDLMRPDKYPEAPHGAFYKQFPSAPIIIGRGCPFECTFCAGARHRYRERSIANVMEEIELLNEKYGVKELLIEDENLTLHRKTVQDFCQALLATNKGYTWSCPSGIRLSCVNLEDLQLMERAGCHSVSLGIEFGSQRIHDLTKKHLTIDLIKEKMEVLAKTNIKTTGFFLLGIPGETLAEMEETVKFALSLPLDRIQVNNFMPLPGSQIWQQLKKRGKDKAINYNRFFVHNVAYVSGGIRETDIKRLQRKAYLKFYLRWKVIKDILRDIKSFKHFKYLIMRFFDALS